MSIRIRRRGVFLLWQEIIFSGGSHGGATFSKPINLSSSIGGDGKGRINRKAWHMRIAGGNDAAPALATGPDSTVYLAWTTDEEKSADIRITRSSDNGRTFSEARIVGPGKGYSDAPKLAVDARRVLHLVYAESENGPFGRYHIRHTYSETPRAISHPLPDQHESAAFPHSASMTAARHPGRESFLERFFLFPTLSA